ncbi:Pantothenate transporter liz1 [Colletotrichum tropicale]|uniref:Major facilitator superfamily transporter n=1 Tax=Colletotrichum asianum TaxID=702518 RepID=A0A8H3ZE27_9PEZI|nr:major facilitator superfamily transporter [Colletotrichum asianum]KAF4825356.1 Pantothenate transporter liz1 [Colletotrichum tropicale]KAF4879009.1 Pantothenate transporter liz1 [Colletotrichum siamense]KAI8243237.1 Pantothenate transporter liz1 [Colletotrichum sp. SAR 10_96]KAI8265866.1 Pantothenate transporter liz1 [Colletotrichum sp. SAR11_239]KAI8297502.1 Pantothenate transporter liz1 [Colletotrichum sp. SAR11_240]
MALDKIRQYLHVEYQPGERKLIQKIDFFILTFCCLSYLVNYLDRTNLNNAYVSGMKEELGFVGDQLNQINTCFTVGYVIGQIPSNLSLHYVKPRFWFPLMMIIWGGLTMCTASVHSPKAIMAIRFFQGVAEASTFVGTHYILGAWYTERELGKRSGIFTASGLAGTFFGGFIQTGIHSSMDGLHGLSGWRWLFIIDGLMTIPVAIYGFIFFPDTPHTTKAFYLTEEERKLAASRVPEIQEKSPLTFRFAKKVLTSWYWWGFVMLWIIAGETESFSTNSLLGLYMKSHPTNKYTIPQLNNYPTGVPAVGIVSTLFWATLTDFLGGKRYLVAYFIGLTGVVTSIMILVAAKDPTSAKSTSVVFGAYYWAGAVYACQATFFAWCNDAMRYEEGVFRGVVLAGMNLGSNAINAWWSIVFYGASMAPWFTRGMWAMIASSIALIVWTTGLTYLTHKEDQRRVLHAQEAEAGSVTKGTDGKDDDNV